MLAHVRAIAIDYDGTLTAGGRPGGDVLAVLRALRRADQRIILVTGRILAELHAEFPDCADHFDQVVGENGAVVAAGSLTMPLAPPVPVAMDETLLEFGVVFRRGKVIVATTAAHELAILRTVRRHASDCQLVRNRGELMLVPAGVSKATGLRYALLQLGISPHGTLAIGDAENDLALLESCEVAVAVANAVESVKERADVVLAEADGTGVARFLREAMLDGTPPPMRRRWTITIGQTPAGAAVRLPAAGIEVVVAGGSGSGKSFAAGLLAEQLIHLGYVVCVLDPEGDHAPLGRLPNVVTLGGRDRAPAGEDLAQIFEQSGTSVVVDLSLLSARERRDWTARTIRFLETRRARSGVPHWLIVDEAHAALGAAEPTSAFDERRRGHCLVTHRPADLAAFVGRHADYLLLVAGREGIDPACVEALSAAAVLPPGALAADRHDMGLGEALLVRLAPTPTVERLRFAPRWVSHVRHWHKYARGQLPVERRFYFRAPHGLTGAVSGNMAEFHHEARRADLDTIRQHAAGGDFSRWMGEVLQDQPLAAAVRRSEQRIRGAASDTEAEAGRQEMLAAIERRYR